MTHDVRANAEHLLHLLNMLPRWDDSFWSDLEENSGWNDEYFIGKMKSVEILLRRELANDLSPQGVLWFAQYILMFFDRDDQKMWAILDRATGFTAAEGRIGRRWAEDACRTAWALYSYGRGEQRDEGGPEDRNR